MTATTEIEVQITESTSQGVEGYNCNLCEKRQIPEDIFPLGTQDPVTKTLALVFVCRTCFVGNISLELRRAIYKLWDI